MAEEFAAAEYNLMIEKGATYERRFRLFQDRAKTIPLNLTGLAARSHVRRSANDSRLLASALVEIEQPATGGWIHYMLTSAQTGGIPSRGRTYADATEAVWDLELYDLETGLLVQRAMHGLVFISPEATHGG